MKGVAHAIFILVMTVSLVMAGGFPAAAQRNENDSAQQPRMKCQDRFKALDTDRNGQVSLDEFKVIPHPYPAPQDVFKVMDTDESGYLNMEEFCQKRGMHRGSTGPGRGMGPGGGMQGPAQPGRTE